MEICDIVSQRGW